MAVGGAGDGGLGCAESPVFGATGAISVKGATDSGTPAGVREQNHPEVTAEPINRTAKISDVPMWEAR